MIHLIFTTEETENIFCVSMTYSVEVVMNKGLKEE